LKIHASFELNSSILEEAISHFNKNDAIFGPAQDGGYYLLGKKR
jgi:glycosyltransferase A (GT-A) superfamily protein (DUF2064 family)